MGCVNLRRAAMVDLRRLDAQALAHAGRCVVCREFLARLLDAEVFGAREDAVMTPLSRGRLAERRSTHSSDATQAGRA